MNYSTLLKKIGAYEKKYKINTIGQTLLGRKIIAVEKVVDESFFTAIFVASVHARENITTDLLCKFLDDGVFDDIKDFNVSIILMANPDGVELSYFGLSSVCDEELKKKLLIANNKNSDFSFWKSNARGVDINNNFDAQFEKHVSSYKMSSQGFAGEFAESELETQAIINFIKTKKVFFVVSYHSKGEEIYFNFFQSQKNKERDEKIANQFSKSTGYKIVNVEKVSSGGLKDWCVEKLKIPSLTIEIGNDNLCHPIKEKYLNEIFLRHKNIANDLNFAYNVFIDYKIKVK